MNILVTFFKALKIDKMQSYGCFGLDVHLEYT